MALSFLKTLSDRLHFVPLFLKLFCLYKFGLPFFSLNFVRYCSGLLLVVLDISLGAGVPRLVYGLGTSFLPPYLFSFEVLRGSKACSVGVLHFLRFPLFFYLALRTSIGPGCSFVLRIRSNPAEASSSGWTGGESDSLAVLVLRVALREPHFPLDKGKGKVNEIRYPSGFEYLRASIQNAKTVGPSQVEPLYGEIFTARYGPPFGIQVWCPDVLTTYVAQVPNMVCFFEVAFENGLRFPLHPFIKRVLQHFNVCPSQLSPNF